MAAAAARLGAGFRAVRVEVGPGPNLEARARAARRAVLPAGSATGPHHGRPGRDRPRQPPAGGGPRRPGRRCGPGPAHPLLGLRRVRDPRPVCAPSASSPCDDPTNADRRFVRNRIRHELLPLASAIAGRDLVPVLRPPGGDPGRRGRACSTSWRRRVDPGDARRSGRGAGPAGPPGHPALAAGNGPPSPRPGRRGAGPGRGPGADGRHRRRPGRAGAAVARGAVVGADRPGGVR